MSTYTFTYRIKNLVPGTCLLNVRYTPDNPSLTPMNVRVPLPEGYEDLGLEHYINSAAPTHFWANEEAAQPRIPSLEGLIGAQGEMTKNHVVEEPEQAPQTQSLEVNRFKLEAHTLSKGSK